MDLTLHGVTWQGPPIDDPALLGELPAELSVLLRQINGFVLFGGVLHVRGAVTEPDWHSVRRAWRDETLAISVLYGLSGDAGVPFAQDCVGDQFLLREGVVWALSAETGELTSTARSLMEFLADAVRDPDETLHPEPLHRFRDDGGDLAPGRLLLAYPPFCTKESEDGVTLKDVPCDELLHFHADFSRQIQGLEEGQKIEVKVSD